MSADCSGASIKEMYASLLDLDEIKSQLEEGGSQLAWGIMLALVSSLPVIGDVFMKLQKWARMIQKLLQDACAIGQALVNDSGLAAKAKGVLGIDGKIESALDGHYGWLEGVDDWLEELDCDLRYSVNDAAHKKCMSNIAETSKDFVKHTASASSGGLLNSMVASNSKLPLDKTTNKLYVGTFKKFVETGKVKTFQVIPSNRMQEIAPMLLFSRMFMEITVPSAKNINENALSLTGFEPGKEGEYDIIPNKLMAQLKALKGNELVKKDSTVETIKPVIPTSKLADVLINGITAESAISNSYTCGTGYCEIPNNYMIFADFAGMSAEEDTTSATGANEDNVMTTTRFLTMISNADTADKITFKWEGALKESYQKVKKMVFDKSGVSGSLGIINYSQIDSSTAVGNIGLVVPGMEKYVSVIAKLEKKAGMETGFTASLKELLAKYNAYLFSKSFLDYLIDQYTAQLSIKPGPTDIGVQKMNAESARDQGLEKFEKILKETNNFKTVIEIFEKIEFNLAKETSSNMI